MVEGGRQPLNDQRAPLADAAAAAEGLPSEPERSYALLVFVTGLSLFNFGYNTASISGALLYIDLDQTDCSAEVVCLTSAFEKGCVVSSVLLGACLGALSGGPLGDRFGRSRALIYNNAFYIIGPVGMALSQSVETLSATRALTGFGVGVSSALVHLYIGESVPAARRGEYGALLVMLGSGGVLVANLVAYALGDMWRLDLGLSAASALLQVLMGPFWMPESPAWLMKRHQHSSNSSSGTASTSPALVEPSPESPPARGSTLLAAASPSTEESSWLLLWKALRSGEVWAEGCRGRSALKQCTAGEGGAGGGGRLAVVAADFWHQRRSLLRPEDIHLGTLLKTLLDFVELRGELGAAGRDPAAGSVGGQGRQANHGPRRLRAHGREPDHLGPGVLHARGGRRRLGSDGGVHLPGGLLHLAGPAAIHHHCRNLPRRLPRARGVAVLGRELALELRCVAHVLANVKHDRRCCHILHLRGRLSSCDGVRLGLRSGDKRRVHGW
mmetsp:Transcript_25883/g.86132  ORF Transcript_25883/g.86132 Transcript_25883/m.86132 type:complete len:499 (+) Transcript_25883:159-1655(+)